MLTPSLSGPDPRGTRWLQAQVQEALVRGAVALAPPPSAHEPSCYWGTDLETETTLSLLVAGDPTPKALPFRRGLITDCGAGHRPRQQQAITHILRTLRPLGILAV